MQAAITNRYSDNDTMKTTHKPRIVADSKIPYLRGILEPYALVSYHAPAEIDNRVAREADMLIIRTRTHIDSHLLQGSPCRFVATATIGYDHIDTAYCAAHGIRWVNAPGCNASSVGQYVLASLLAWANARQRHLPDLTIGIVGAGHVGKVVEQYCKAIGMRVLLNDPPRARAEGAEKFVSLATIAAEADIVTFHTPLTAEGSDATYHLGSAEFFAATQRKPLIINSSRGAVVDNKALLKALSQGEICDVIMDCWEGEPQIDAALLAAAFIATPHIAGYSADGKSNATRMTVEAVAREMGITIETSTIVPPLPPVATIGVEGLADGLSAAVLSSYNPLTETAQLKQHPETFEAMRNSYGLRREFPAYTVTGAKEEEAAILRRLGFHIA